MTKNASSAKTVLALGGLLTLGLGVQFYLFPRLGSLPESLSTVPSASAKDQKDKKNKTSFLTCSTLRERTRDFLKMHYSVRKFDEEISSRTYQKYFQFLDPGKNFFLQSDIDSFAALEKKVGENVNKVDCRFMQDIYAVYVKRLRESGPLIDTELKTPFNFKVDESIETDRKKIVWTKDTTELKERWRKLLKFSAMGMRETEPDWAKLSSRLSKRYALVRKNMEDKSSDEIHGIFMNAFTAALDPHSQYLMPEDQDEFKVAFSLQLVGIGASLTQQDGFTIVDSVIPGGAAARDGRLKKADKIVAVDSGDGTGFVDVIDMDLNKVVQLIRGKKDTLVKLSILRKDEKNNEMKRQTLDLTRAVVRLSDGEAHSDVIEVGKRKVGVINLPSFYIDYQGSKSGGDDYRSSANDMAREIKKLQSRGVDGIIVDLRRDGGGDLGECIRITGQFIDRGSVVQVQGRDGDVESLDDKDSGVLYSGPLAVMVSKQSASASEIFAGAVQDYGRGILVGDSRTYGKGTVQNVIEIPGTGGRDSDGAMKVTISKFFRPSGKSNQEKGVLSDIVIPDIIDVSDIGEAENDFVLPYSTIDASKQFKPIQDLSAPITTLRKKSEDRVKAAAEFKEVFTAIEKAKKEKENTLLSLKIDDTKKDKMSADTKGNKADSKGGKKGDKADKGAPSAKVEGSPGANPSPETSAQVVRPDDHQLQEAARILLDSVDLLGGKTDWTR